MNKKIIIIITILLTILIVVPAIILNLKHEKFYINDKYYNNGKFIKITSNDLNNLINSKDSFLLYTYNDYCSLKIPCDDIFRSVMNKYKIDMYSIRYEEFEKTDYINKVKYAPSVLIIKNGKIVTYLDANKKEDLDRYQDTSSFENWLDKYIYLSK